MGKYTSLARSFRDDEQPEVEAHEAFEGCIVGKDIYVYSLNEQKIDKEPPSRGKLPKNSSTILRTTNLTNLKPAERDEKRVICLHQLDQDVCAVCSGYARWLIGGDTRLRAAQADPEGMRRRYRETLDGSTS